jgi:beta-galactosidase
VLFVNGDLQYLDLIATTCPSIDILGVNAYRGKTFGDLWQRAESTLHKPVLLIEFGCDAFNAVTSQEDQDAQAEWLRAQFLDMRDHAAGGKDGPRVCLGGTIFEFADEWWKFGQESQLDVHNTEANWASAGYTFDFVQGRNNMNEEWWGLCSIKKEQVDGLNPRRPRKACDVIREVWGSPRQRSSTATH